VKTPRSKIQDPEKLQVPSSNAFIEAWLSVEVWRFVGVWCLVFGVSLELGAWSLELFS